MKKTAVILSGSGHLDGAEIRESIATLWALDHHARNVEVEVFAPDVAQADVVDHRTGEAVAGETRNALAEASRIARGAIRPLDDLNPDEFAALFLPGGFGAAKTLSDFATRGAEGAVMPKLHEILHKAHVDRKPIGAMCIAPAIVGLAFKDHGGLELTVGQPGDAAGEIEKMGHKHVVCATNGCHVDTSARIVTTPAYMKEDAPIKDVFTGIHKLVNETLSLS